MLKNGNIPSPNSKHRSILSATTSTSGYGSLSNFLHEHGVNIHSMDLTFHRPQDSLLIVPGSKHIFEAGGGMIVEVTCDGVIAWLKEHIHHCNPGGRG